MSLAPILPKVISKIQEKEKDGQIPRFVVLSDDVIKDLMSELNMGIFEVQDSDPNSKDEILGLPLYKVDNRKELIDVG